MESRRDQVQAYFFVVGRLAAAVTHGRPNALEGPNRRFKLGTILGILLAVLLVGIFGIVGLISPGGNTSWRKAGTIVMEEDSGTRYVYLDGTLRPVLNYASARLASGGSTQVVSVSEDSLSNTPVGQPIGIPGAPDSLPTAGKLHSGPWTVCVQPGSGPASARPVVTLRLDQRPGPAIRPDQAILVSGPDSTRYLLWQGRRHRVASSSVIETLGYADVPAIRVTSSWLNSIPQGPDIGVPDTPGAGDPGPSIGGGPSRVGQIFEVRNPVLERSQFYLLRVDGLAPLSPTAAALLLAKPTTGQAYPDGAPVPIELGTGALAGITTSKSGPNLVDKLPPTPPTEVRAGPDTALCARRSLAADAPTRVKFQLTPISAVNKGAMPVAVHLSGRTADRVAIPLGGGALIRAAGSGPVYLITETGTRFPLGGADALKALGYSESDVVPLPGQLLELLPAGPVLTTKAALRPRTPQR